jgi:hypothetical protein
LGGLVESSISLLGLASRTGGGVGLDLGPQRLVGGAHLAGDGTRHLGGQIKVGADVVVCAVLQAHRIAHLAMREGVPTHIVQRVAVG